MTNADGTDVDLNQDHLGSESDQINVNIDSTDVRDNIGQLSKTIHEPVRLGIMLLLEQYGTLTFGEVQRSLEISPGNLDSHVNRLAKEGFVRRVKTILNLRPRTVLQITEKGSIALARHARALLQLLQPSDQ